MKVVQMKSIPIRRLNPTEEPLSSDGFSIRTIQSILKAEGLPPMRHRHDFFFVIALEKAKGEHEIDFVSHKVANHTVFFLRPGQVHQIKLDLMSIGYLVKFNTDFLHSHDKSSNQLLRKASHKNSCQLDAGGFKKLFSVLNNVSQEFAAKQEDYLEVIKSNMKIFFIELLRQSENLSRPANIEKKYQQERLEEFLELVETRHAAQKQVQHYAGHLNLSSYQLNAITKATLGKTSSEIIDEYIVLEAKRYLFATSNLVSQIANLLGYEDVSYFIRFFKKHTGYSPEAFRNNFR
jgi:AraC-like DNA-binding protein